MATGFWKKVEPGTLNKRVTFCRNTDTVDSYGKITNGTEEVITLWADFYPVRGQEFYEVQKIQGKVTHKCYCRYHSALSEINSNWYILYKGKKYTVESAVDGGLDKRYFEIYCTEHINDDEIPDAPEPDFPDGGDDLWMG